MKRILIFIALTASTSLLGGCMKDITACSDPDHCTTFCTANSPCGKALRNRCESSCGSCNFNEHSCTTCWTCLNGNANH